ncbi:sugar transporter [Chelonobacter oris]|uniref:Sugar transporter n=1 Tax=Chelonobacter oris TaxID=505317 RepID=A0A0A3AUU5_9PAST|nr:YbfB/YjiJ family MFS transporter [Chelonobacter oris]KGQ70880.1 sugar transporter [Chelonobacter oris]MDH2999356.1 sugar transporter [Chelonobacter oris]
MALHNPALIGIKACLILAVGMGFGRFAFTAIYPYMVDEQLLTVTEGSIAASMNYIGYLIGALAAIKIKPHHADVMCICALLGTTLCLLLLALPLSSLWIIVIRGIAGIFSALSIIGSSMWLFSQRGLHRQAPLLYAGVGLGIALSAEVVVIGNHVLLTSSALWLLLAIISIVIVLFVIRDLRRTAPLLSAQSAKTALTRPDFHAVPLVIMYGLAGFGYIITATYLPLFVKLAMPTLNVGHIWAAFGLGAVPSCFIWHKLRHKLGSKRALILNLWLQAIGVVLPVLLNNNLGYVSSALLVGGTFMGTVTIAMAQAQLLAHHSGRNLLAIMTVAYGIGQIAGPLIADRLYQIEHSFNLSLLIAAAVLIGGAIIIAKKESKAVKGE